MLAAGCMAGQALQVHVIMAPKPPQTQSVAPLLYGQFSPAMVQAAPLFGAAAGHVVPPLLLLLLAAPLAALVLVPPLVAPPAPTLEVVDVPLPVDCVPAPPLPVEAVPLPDDELLPSSLTEPPQACTMATNAIPKDAMAALLFIILS